MKRWGLLLVAALGLVLPGSAGAVTLVTEDGSPVPAKFARWTRAMRVPSPDATVLLYDDRPCPAYRPAERSCTYPTNRADTFVMYLAGRERSNGPRWVYYHEIGHVFGVMRARRSEGFADRYAFCAYGISIKGCGAIRHAGGWFMRPAF